MDYYLRNEGVEPDCDFFYSRNFYMLNNPLIKSSYHPLRFKGGARLGIKINEWLAKRALKKDFDLFHPTYYDPYFLEKLTSPLVMTVYDMTHEKYPNLFSGDDPTPSNKKRTLEAADRIISISHSTKKDVIEFLGIPEEKIDVIHLANSLSSIDETKLKRVHDRPYLLFVGGRRTYKNFDYTVETLKDTLIDRELDYICAGSGSFSEEEKKFFKKLGIEKRMIQMDVDDEKLASLYKYCECFIFPSLYEGFGLPAIESMSFGAPTILSDRSSLPEVGGDFALYINPEDAQSLINKVENVLSSHFNKEEFSKKAKSWANNFSWEKMAIETVKTYERTLNL